MCMETNEAMARPDRLSCDLHSLNDTQQGKILHEISLRKEPTLSWFIGVHHHLSFRAE